MVRSSISHRNVHSRLGPEGGLAALKENGYAAEGERLCRLIIDYALCADRQGTDLSAVDVIKHKSLSSKVALVTVLTTLISSLL